MENLKRILIVQHSFDLNTAKTQRMLASANVYNQCGLEVVFIISTTDHDDFKTIYPNYSFVIIPERGSSKLLCYKSFVKSIKEYYSDQTVILFYGIPYYSFLFKYPKYRVFSEETEVPFRGDRLSIRNILQYAITMHAVKSFSGLFVISSSLKEYYQKRGVKNISIINMFVDPARFSGLKRNSEDKYIGYCGTVSIIKDGVDDLIKAFSVFVQKYNDYKLYIFGGFENDGVEKSLKELVCQLGITESVIFFGPVASINMPQLLFDAKFLVLSRPNNKQAQYGFPTKLGEYLASGNPVVVTEVGEISNFLKDGKNAYLSEPGDYLAFADKMTQVVDDFEEAQKIASRGKTLIYNEFSSEVQTKKALQFMASII